MGASELLDPEVGEFVWSWRLPIIIIIIVIIIIIIIIIIKRRCPGSKQKSQLEQSDGGL